MDLPYQQQPLAALRPYPRNARRHTKKQIRQIAASIERFGFVNPVLVTPGNEVIAGHGRVEAAKLLGLATVPTLALSHLGEAERRAYVIADNRLAEQAGWDKDLLALELQGLVDLDFEVELTGFSLGEIEVILDEAAEKQADTSGEDDVHEPDGSRAAVSRAGDLWCLGEHRLLCGDALRGEAYDRLLGSERVAAVFTDPPYNVPIAGHVSGHGKVVHREFAMGCGEMSEDEFVAFLRASLGIAAEYATNGAILFVCMDWRHAFELVAAGRGLGLELKNLCVWNKDNAGMGSFYRSKHELVFVWKAGNAPHLNTFELGQHGRHRTNVWDYPGVTTFRADRREELALHPTVKPVALVADAIKDVTRRRALVLDPFCGSGTTLLAAEKTGRRGRGIELDPAYVDVAVRRWQRATGRPATLAETGATFEEVTDLRLGAGPNHSTEQGRREGEDLGAAPADVVEAPREAA
jgi:DNA modification methylase